MKNSNKKEELYSRPFSYAVKDYVFVASIGLAQIATVIIVNNLFG